MIVIILYLLPALFFGWSLGANDAANVFGPPVASKLVKYKNAVLLSALFIILGAVLQGKNGMETMKEVSSYSLLSSSLSVLSAALTMTIMTYLKVPVSSSQAIVGAIIGMNLSTNNAVNWSVISKLVLAWVGTPLGGLAIGFVSYKFSIIYFKKIKSPLNQDKILKILAITFGCYGSYALGANNVANITGVFANHFGTTACAIIGGFAIAVGVLTYSKRVMYSVGKEIANLDYFSSTMVIFAESLTVWIYALLGIPVSTSQAVVGAVLGTSIAAGNAQIRTKQVFKIVIAWVNTPISAGLIAIAFTLIFKLFGIYF